MVFFYNLYSKFISPIDTRGRILIENMGFEKVPFQMKSTFPPESTFSASILSLRNGLRYKCTRIFYFVIVLSTMASHKTFYIFEKVFRRYLVKSSALSAAAALSCSNAACHSRGGGVDRTGWWAGFRAWLSTPPLKYVIRL
jgi:predicted CxxxxCH...CXXCH cytochrome family protein